jgi:alginate O-acetyltransferase complex protein AlgI
LAFHSFTFGIFFALVAAVHWGALRTQKSRVVWLLLGSIVFYASWSLPFSLLLFATLGVDWALGLAIARWPAWRKTWLVVSIVSNLGVLSFFKYGAFFASAVRGALGLPPGHDPGFVLPLGISFYTFQSLGYVIDVYRGAHPPIRSLSRFALFVTFFPQLVAGPIVKAAELAPQFETERAVDGDDFFWGAHRIAIGLFKKVVLADWIAVLIEPIFADPGAHSAAANVLAVYGFAIQVLCDFGAYCDIGIGCGRLLGYRLPENFVRPYLSPTLGVFWRHWHVTLGRWFRENVYIPIGGSRRGPSRTALSLLVTMTLGGLWHGAAWHFVLWGLVCGVLVACERLLGREKGSAFVTFNLHAATLVLFRSASVPDAMVLYRRVLSSAVHLATFGTTAGAIALSAVGLVAYRRLCDLSDRIVAWRPLGLSQEVAYSGAVAALLLVLAAAGAPTAEFVYFQF